MNEDLKEKILAVNYWQIWIFSTSSILHAKCHQFLCVKIFVWKWQYFFYGINIQWPKAGNHILSQFVLLTLNFILIVKCSHGFEHHRFHTGITPQSKQWNYNSILLSIVIKRTLLRKREFVLSRRFLMLLWKVWEKFYTGKNNEETYKSWSWMSKLHENTARYAHLLERSIFT